MKIKPNDVIVMRDNKAYLVLEGESFTGIEGELTVVEIDENNNYIGNPFVYKLSFSSPIVDIIR